MMKTPPPPKMGTSRKVGKRGGIGQYVGFILVIVIAIILVIVLVSGGRKKTRATSKQIRATSNQLVEGDEITPRGRASSTRTRGSSRRGQSRLERKEERRRLREARRKERVQRGLSRKTKRTGKISPQSRAGATASKSAAPVLKAIVSEPTGHRIAIIGERRVRKGDQIDGRKITEVEQDRVKVEYLSKSYEVKLSQPLY